MGSITRRTLVRGVPTVAALASLTAPGAARAARGIMGAAGSAAAGDETYWATIQAQYDINRAVVPLENGNWGVMSRPVQQAYAENLQRVNFDNTFYARRSYGADLSAVGERLAGVLGVSPDEIAFTRNATEALQALIGGYNRLSPGDAVLYADLDYDAMQTAMRWLAERRGVEVVRIALPEPAGHDSLIEAYAAALDANPRIRMMLLTHLSHRTGLVLPVAEIVDMARSRGVDAIVDAAHAWGQMDYALPSLGADFVGLNLHKWMGAPLGVGALYIRRDRLPHIDPFMGEESPSPGSASARVHTGTANFAAFLTVPAALDFQAGVGAGRKAARLAYLRSLWVEPLRGHPGIEILTPSDPSLSAGITAFRLAGQTGPEQNRAAAEQLLQRFGIYTVHRVGAASGACVRVTPALFNTFEDMIRLRDALRIMADEGAGILGSVKGQDR